MRFTCAGAEKEVVVDYNNPKTYTIGDIKITGVDYLREEQILSLTGLQKGMPLQYRETKYLKY